MTAQGSAFEAGWCPCRPDEACPSYVPFERGDLIEVESAPGSWGPAVYISPTPAEAGQFHAGHHAAYVYGVGHRASIHPDRIRRRTETVLADADYVRAIRGGQDRPGAYPRAPSSSGREPCTPQPDAEHLVGETDAQVDAEPFGFSAVEYVGALQVDLPPSLDGLLIARGTREEVIAELERFIAEAQHTLDVVRAGGTRRAEWDAATGFTGRYIDEPAASGTSS